MVDFLNFYSGGYVFKSGGHRLKLRTIYFEFRRVSFMVMPFYQFCFGKQIPVIFKVLRMTLLKTFLCPTYLNILPSGLTFYSRRKVSKK